MIRHIFNICLVDGIFPKIWKKANLVLIPKPTKAGMPEPEIPKVRPICLLDEMGKAFERILVMRIQRWQEEHPERGLAENQFGFRKHRSTCDAIQLVKNLTNESTENGGFAIAVALDIRNAFNSIQWRVIRRVLRRQGYPSYIRRIIDAYLSERDICYVGKDVYQHIRPMEAGVPQSSVLGPMLWNIAFDSVIRLADDEDHCNIICYADDTLAIVTGKNLLRASELAYL